MQRLFSSSNDWEKAKKKATQVMLFGETAVEVQQVHLCATNGSMDASKISGLQSV